MIFTIHFGENTRIFGNHHFSCFGSGSQQFERDEAAPGSAGAIVVARFPPEFVLNESKGHAKHAPKEVWNVYLYESCGSLWHM